MESCVLEDDAVNLSKFCRELNRAGFALSGPAFFRFNRIDHFEFPKLKAPRISLLLIILAFFAAPAAVTALQPENQWATEDVSSLIQTKLNGIFNNSLAGEVLGDNVAEDATCTVIAATGIEASG